MGNPSAGILVLLLAVYLLLSFFTGGLDWLFRLGSTVSGAQGTGTGTNTPPDHPGGGGTQAIAIGGNPAARRVRA